MIAFEVATFHARGAWPRWNGFDMTHSASGTASAADGSQVAFDCSRHHKAGEGCDVAVTLYSAARRELTAAKWNALRNEVRNLFTGHVRQMADGPRPAAIHPGTKSPAMAAQLADATDSPDALQHKLATDPDYLPSGPHYVVAVGAAPDHAGDCVRVTPEAGEPFTVNRAACPLRTDGRRPDTRGPLLGDDVRAFPRTDDLGAFHPAAHDVHGRPLPLAEKHSTTGRDEVRRAVNVSGTWRGLLPVLLAAVRDGTPRGQDLAREELERMATAADAYNAETIS